MSKTRAINKVAVLGSSGMLGYAVSAYYSKQGYEVILVDRKSFEASKDSVEVLRSKFTGCDYVVNCMGIIKPRIGDVPPELCLLVNGIFPKNLAKLTQNMGIPCFHITTDCVYSGEKGNYSEDDYYDVGDMYGLSKSAGETTDCMTLRTSIIGEEINNKYSLFEWAKSQKGKRVTGYSNHVWNGVTTLYLAEILEKIYRGGLYERGIFHIYSPTKVTKYELLVIMNEVYELELDIHKKDAPESIFRDLTSKYPLSQKAVTKELSQQISEMHDFFSIKK